MNNQTFNQKPTFNSNVELNTISNQTNNYPNNTDSIPNLYIRKMVHEVNNIVTIINSSLQIIESSHPEIQAFKYWNTTMEDIQYLIKLLSQISSFNVSKSIELEPVNLVALINNTIESFTSNSNYSNISILLTCKNEIPIISADKTKLKQVFVNIIKNGLEALKISENSNTEPYIHINLNYSNNNISIKIQDNGCGITSEQIDKIFSPLISFKPNGNGLGLPISKNIIEAHGGTIYVESSPGYGTSFFINLPI